MRDHTEEAIAPKPKRRKLYARPKCPGDVDPERGFHQYEIVRRTKLYVTSHCRLCGRVVRRPTEEPGRV